MLTTNQKGAVAETAIAHEAIKLGIGVYRPYADERFDLVFDLGAEFLRVQCKSARRRGEVLVIGLYSRCRSPRGVVTRLYTADEVDAFAAYCAETGQCYFFRTAGLGVTRAIQLRLGPTRNNQERGVRWAEEYEFAATLARRLGP